jgi:hypothetical protein
MFNLQLEPKPNSYKRKLLNYRIKDTFSSCIVGDHVHEYIPLSTPKDLLER